MKNGERYSRKSFIPAHIDDDDDDDGDDDDGDDEDDDIHIYIYTYTYMWVCMNAFDQKKLGQELKRDSRESMLSAFLDEDDEDNEI